MKRILVFLLCLAVVEVVSNKVWANELGPVLVNAHPDAVFAPAGFDDNDDVQIVVEGMLSDTCHKSGPIYTRIDADKKTIYVTPMAYYYPGSWCAQVEVPFVRTVALGIFPRGSYSIVVEQGDGKFAKMADLPIAVSKNSGPDDYLYAPVTDVEVRTQGTTPKLVLRGKFTNTCMHLTEVKMVNAPKNVLAVMPIAEMGTENCKAEIRAWETTVEIKTPLQGKTLVHVRSLDGQSVNRVVEF